jgi:hypothetical protein
LPEIETVERLVHEQEGVRRQQCERQHQAAAEALRQRAHALAQHRPEAERANDLRDGALSPAIHGHEQLDHPGDILIFPGPQSVRQVEQELAAMRQADRSIAPKNPAGVGGDDAGDRLHERGLAGAIGSDQAEHLAGIDRKRDVGERALFAVLLAEPGNLHQRRGPIANLITEQAIRQRHASP